MVKLVLLVRHLAAPVVTAVLESTAQTELLVKTVQPESFRDQRVKVLVVIVQQARGHQLGFQFVLFVSQANTLRRWV